MLFSDLRFKRLDFRLKRTDFSSRFFLGFFLGLKFIILGLKSARLGLKSAISGLKLVLSDLIFDLLHLKFAFLDLKPEKTDFRFEMADFRSERADHGFKGGRLTGGRTDGWKRWINKSLLCSIGLCLLRAICFGFSHLDLQLCKLG